MLKNTKTVLLTGAMGGLGAAIINVLIKNKWHVFATDINSGVFDKYKDNDAITPVLMDVTNLDSIEKAFAIITEQTRGLDAIINLAGMLVVGSVAELPIETIEKILEVNLLGVYRVNQQFLPLILNRKGRIINISSETGWQTAAPFNGAYAMSKYALEAYSDALRRELSFLGILVIKIQPGPFKTEMTKQVESLFSNAEKNSSFFKNPLNKGRSYLPEVYKKAHDPKILAHTILRALTIRKPKIAYSVKPDKMRSFLEKLPVKWSDALIKKALS